MTAAFGIATPGARPEPISVTFGRLRRMGFDEREAANLTALKNGLGITSHPWTVSELAHLIFLRESPRACRSLSDAYDLIDTEPCVGDRASLPAGQPRSPDPTRPTVP